MTRTIFNNIREEILSYLTSAKYEILVAVAWFTDDILFRKLAEALSKGVNVSVLLNDDDINQFSGINFIELSNKGANIFLYDTDDNTMHQKFCVIDSATVLVGSYNWTKRAASKNTENLIIIENEIAAALNFKNQFKELQIKSKPFKKKEKFNSSIDFIIDEFVSITPKIAKPQINLSEEYNSYDFPNPDLIPFRVHQRWGFCDKNRNIKIPLLFDEARQYCDGIAAVKVDMKWGFIDSEGKKICDCKFNKVKDFKNGYAPVKPTIMESWGSIDRMGNIIIPTQYGYCGDFIDGLFCVYTIGMTGAGYVDKRNKEIIPLKYQHGLDFSENIAGVCRRTISNKGVYLYDWIFIDRNNQMIFDKSFSNLNSFNQGYASIYYKSEGTVYAKHGLINSNGEFVIQPQYSSISYLYSEGLIAAEKEFKKKGEWGNYGVNLWGYVDVNNVEVIPFKFDYARPFRDNRAAVKHPDNKKYGYIDLKGRLIIDYIFDEASQFKNKLARVNIGGQYGCNGYIDVNGNQYWED